jgi:hypothetical protein
VNVERFLPLTPVVFEIALALAAGERHGYEIMQEVERRTEGQIVLHPGTLYARSAVFSIRVSSRNWTNARPAAMTTSAAATTA